MPSDWFVMDDSDGDMIYTYTMMLETGVEYGYNFSKDVPNNGYELARATDCAGGLYYNDRYVTPGDVDITLDTACFGSCESCPEVVLVALILQQQIIMQSLILMIIVVNMEQ